MTFSFASAQSPGWLLWAWYCGKSEEVTSMRMRGACGKGITDIAYIQRHLHWSSRYIPLSPWQFMTDGRTGCTDMIRVSFRGHFIDAGEKGRIFPIRPDPHLHLDLSVDDPFFFQRLRQERNYIFPPSWLSCRRLPVFSQLASVQSPPFVGTGSSGSYV